MNFPVLSRTVTSVVTTSVVARNVGLWVCCAETSATRQHRQSDPDDPRSRRWVFMAIFAPGHYARRPGPPRRALVRCRPPRRPRRRDGSSAGIASSSASMVGACCADRRLVGPAIRIETPSPARAARLALQASAPAGRCAGMTSLNRLRSALRRRARQVVRAEERDVFRRPVAGRQRRSWRLPGLARCGLDLACARAGRRFGPRVTTASRVSAFQSKLRSGCVCSSASMTSASSGCPAHSQIAPAIRKTYSTRGRGGPFAGRAACMT